MLMSFLVAFEKAETQAFPHILELSSSSQKSRPLPKPYAHRF